MFIHPITPEDVVVFIILLIGLAVLAGGRKKK